MVVCRALLANALLFALVGCDSLHSDQILVRSSAPESLAVTQDKEAAVAQALSVVAQEFGMLDQLEHAQMQEAVAYYVEQSDTFPIAIGARRVNEALIVDLRHFVPGTRETDRYVEIRSALLRELTARLGPGSVSLLEHRDHEP